MDSPHAQIGEHLNSLEGQIEQVSRSAFWDGFWTAIGVSAALFAIYFALSSIKVWAADEQVTAQIEQEAHEEKRKTSIGIPMPLDCDFTMRVSVAGVVERETCHNREATSRKREMP